MKRLALGPEMEINGSGIFYGTREANLLRKCTVIVERKGETARGDLVLVDE